MISASEFLKWAYVFKLLPAGGGGGVSAADVQRSAFNYGEDTGVADAYIVNLDPPVAMLTDGLIVAFRAANANTDPVPTLKINDNSPVQIKLPSQFPLLRGDVTGTIVQTYVYSSLAGQFSLLDPGISNAAADTVTTGVYNALYDQGTPNNYSSFTYINQFSNAQLLQAPGAIYPIAIAGGNDNTGPSTIEINDGDPIAINYADGTALIGGEIKGLRNYLLAVNQGGTAFTLLNPTPIVAPSAASTLSLGVSFQNTTGYDVLLTVYLEVTSSTTADILLGVDAVDPPTQQTIIASFTTAAPIIIPIPIAIPNNSYALLSTSGTITAAISGQIQMSN